MKGKNDKEKDDQEQGKAAVRRLLRGPAQTG